MVAGPSRAGKSSAAQVLAELMVWSGRSVHVISLDGWLKPSDARSEGLGVLNRYDMKAALSLLMPLIASDSRQRIQIPEYERKSRTIHKSIPFSIGPEDFIIIEGVTALLVNPLLECTNVRIFVNVNDEIRHKRLVDDYKWRGSSPGEIEGLVASREKDELPLVLASSQHATHHITT